MLGESLQLDWHKAGQKKAGGIEISSLNFRLDQERRDFV
jgi:hypothetical protein